MKKDKLHNNKLEERLQKEAEYFEMQPSGAVWENIRHSLPSAGKKVFFLRWVTAAAILLLLCGLGWYFLNDSSNQKQTYPSLVVTDSVQNIPHKKDQMTISNREDTKLAKQEQEQVKNNPVIHQKGINENLVIANSDLPFLQHITHLSTNETFDKEIAPLHYSDRIVELMLDEVRPEAPLLAQNNSSQSEKNKITVGLFFTPGVSYRTLKTGSSARRQSFASPNMDVALRPNTQELSSFMQINTEDKPLQQKQSWGWDSGVRVALRLPHNWLLQTGLSLRQTNYDITAYRQDPAYVYNNGSASTMAVGPLANSTYARYSSRYSANKQATTLENSYLSTELPLLIGRRFGQPDKFSFTILAGAGLTYLLHSNSVMYAPGSQRYFTDEDYLSPFNSSLILEANVNIPLSENLGFSIGPAFQYQLFSSYKNYDPVKEFPYLIGLKTAFHLK